MLDIDRQTAAMRKAEKRALAAFLSLTDRHPDWAGDAAPAARVRGSLGLPILLVIVLAAAAIWLSPTTAQLYAKLGDFPCGP